ncbi:MAG: hypothetical protein KKA65_01445, partial [Nanoarchaeota archaeon]|nr:hypothetical protein [Nanoarchaeota archaeon]
SFSGNIIDNNKLKEVADKHGLELIIAPFDPNIYFLRDIDENPIAIIDEAFYRDKEEKGATIVIESFRHLLLEDILAIFKD